MTLNGLRIRVRSYQVTKSMAVDLFVISSLVKHMIVSEVDVLSVLGVVHLACNYASTRSLTFV